MEKTSKDVHRAMQELKQEVNSSFAVHKFDARATSNGQVTLQILAEIDAEKARKQYCFIGPYGVNTNDDDSWIIL